MNSVNMVEAVVEITNRCPLNCIHCSSESTFSNNDELPFDIVSSIIKQLIELGIKTIVLSGGEPTCHSKIKDIIKYLARFDVMVKIYSCGSSSRNGILAPIRRDVIEEIGTNIHTNVKFIYSMHSSNSDTHDFITNTSESYNNLIEALDLSHNINIPTEVHFVPTRINHTDIRTVCELCRDKNVDKVSILRFVPQGRGKTNKDILVMNNDETKQFINEIDFVRKEFGNEYIRTGSPFTCMEEGNSYFCTAGTDKIVIDSNGNVFPCEAFKKIPEPSGSIFKDSLNNIIVNDDLFKKLKGRIMIDECSKCSYERVCYGGCPAQAYLFSDGVSLSGDPFCIKRLNER